jgi:ElaA protein
MQSPTTLQTKSFAELTANALYALLQLRSEVFVVEQNCVYQDLDGLDQTAMHFLLFDGPLLVGCARLLPPTLPTVQMPHIGRLVVRQSHRNKNLARQLMQTAMAYCAMNFPGPMALNGQSYLVSFYESLGFEKVGPEFLEDGIPHYHMVKY